MASENDAHLRRRITRPVHDGSTLDDDHGENSDHEHDHEHEANHFVLFMLLNVVMFSAGAGIFYLLGGWFQHDAKDAEI